MKHLGLFEGIGGFSLAARWMGWETVAWVEINKFCQQVLKKNFPEAKGYGDIKEFDGTQYRGAIDILTGGFPCQPFSVAGDQQGTDDDRYLWPEMLRVVDETEVPVIVGENVTGIIELALSEVILSLENRGYKTETFVIPACAAGANHRRDRVWIVAYSDRLRSQRCVRRMQEDKIERDFNAQILPSLPLRRDKNILSKPYIIGGNDGVSDRAHRIKALGNAIVPQVAYEIFKAIQLTRRVQLPGE